MRVRSSVDRQRGRTPHPPRGEPRRGDDLPHDLRQEPRERQGERRLARAVGTRHDRAGALRNDDVEPRAHGRPAVAADRETGCRERGIHRRGNRSEHRQVDRTPRHPHARRGERVTVLGEHPRGRAVGEQSAAGARTITRVTRSAHTAVRCSMSTRVVSSRAMTRSTAARTSRTPSGSRLAVGSSSSRSPGRIASTPASARRCFCPPDNAFVGRSSGTSRPTDASASATREGMASAGKPEVLAAERDVVADLRPARPPTRGPAGRDRCGRAAPRAAARRRGCDPWPHPRRCPEEAGEPGEERRLPRAGRAEEEHRSPGSIVRSTSRVAGRRRPA